MTAHADRGTTYVFLALGVVLAVRARQGSLETLVKLLKGFSLPGGLERLRVELHQHVGVRLVVQLACTPIRTVSALHARMHGGTTTNPGFS
jgi:hypothetical protein